MKIFEKLFKNKNAENLDANEEIALSDENNVSEIASDAEVLPISGESVVDEMQKVNQNVIDIKSQTPIKSLLSGSKNERALAENDAIISNVIKNILNWLAVITSAETVRKDEYDELTSKMVQLNDDVNDQIEMQIKFKRAYQIMMQKQEEYTRLEEKVNKLQRENTVVKIISCIAMLVSGAAIAFSLIL